LRVMTPISLLEKPRGYKGLVSAGGKINLDV
jgi:hypothetical protein